MARRKQNNKYLIGFRDGSSVMLTASHMNEAKNTARRMGEAMTVQRVYKHSTQICQNVRGKMHSI